MENNEKSLKVELEGPQNAGIKSAGYRLPVANNQNNKRAISSKNDFLYWKLSPRSTRSAFEIKNKTEEKKITIFEQMPFSENQRMDGEIRAKLKAPPYKALCSHG